ncbi:MAG: ABC transporter substrate-binding protein [Thermoprotei archaeon]
MVIAVVAIIIVVIGAGAVLTLTRPHNSTSTTTSSTSLTTGTSTTSSTTQTVTTGANKSLVVEEGQQPDSLDPAVTYETPGWEIADQVYQGLVAPNGTSIFSYVGVLAQNWSISSNGMNYTFNLRRGVTFSNGDPFTAYDVWFSVYRTLIMNQAPAWILGQNLAPGNGGNFVVNSTIINSINYTDPTPSQLKMMEYSNQSVQVLGPYKVEFHLGFGYNGHQPYNEFLATLTTPMAMAVDPAYVEAHGGVVANQTNSWMETHALGTGFYTLQSWVQGESITLQKNTNYWGYHVPKSQLNYAIKPAIIDSITIYYKSATSRIADIQSGKAQIIEAPVFDYSQLKGLQGVNTTVLPIQFGSAEDAYYIYMDQQYFPAFQNKLVREAIAHALDYSGIIKDVFSGLAVQWVGPVPPGFQYYNQTTNGFKPYSYDPTLAAELLAKAGYQSVLPNGTKLNPNGEKFPSVSFLYTTDSATETEAAQIIQSELQAIGIPVTLAPLEVQQYDGVIYSTGNTTYPFGLTYYSEDYTASIDYVTALTEDGYVGTSEYLNSTVMAWTVEASTTLSTSVQIQAFRNITQAMYNQYTDIWLYVPYFLSVNLDYVHGMIPNPAGSGAGYFMFYNSVYET